MLFRWFAGLSLDGPTLHLTTFTKNRDWLLAHSVDERFLAKVVGQPHSRKLLSHNRFSLGGPLLDAGASIKPFLPKERAATAGLSRHAPDQPDLPVNDAPRTCGFVERERASPPSCVTWVGSDRKPPLSDELVE